jgi:hypothetical protein
MPPPVRSPLPVHSPQSSPLPSQLAAASAHGTIGPARAPSTTPPPPPPIHVQLDPAEQQQLQRRASQRGTARLLAGSASAASTNAPARRWKMNDVARAKLENILGMSLAPHNAEQADALRAALDREIAGLTHYEKEVETFQKEKKQPDETITRLDAQYCDHMLAMETIRHPDLDTAHFDNLPGLIKHLREHLENGQPLARQALVRCGKDEEESDHHVAFDIVNRDGTLSLIGIEPANLVHSVVRRSIEHVNDALEELAPRHPYKWSFIASNIQNSERGCLMFGLSNAKKMNDEKPFMDGLHKKQIAGEPFYEPGPDHEDFEALENDIKGASTNMHQAAAEGGDFLPLRMFKLAQSPRGIEAMGNSRPEVYTVPVNKPKDDREAQALYDRVASHSEPRRKGLRTINYSTSSEEKRADTVKKTKSLFEELRANVPVFD